MTLHIFSTDNSDTFEQLKNCLNSGDAIILIKDGCFIQHKFAESYFSNFDVFILKPHLSARNLSSSLPRVDYSEFASLTAQHKNSISW